MSLRLTVLGCAGTRPAVDRACSSYLVEVDGYRLLLDCGNGSSMNLQRRCDVADIDALVLSHLHPDHFADIYGLYYALRFHADGPRSVPVYAPAGSEQFIGQLLDDTDTFARTCRFSAARAGDVLHLGPLTVTLFAGNHPVETLVSRVEAAGHVVTYTGDTAPAEALRDAARDADVLLADSTWLERHRPLPSDVHMTAHEAGSLAAEAGVRRLIVTHVYPSNDPETAVDEARGAYDGDVTPARDLLEIEL